MRGFSGFKSNGDPKKRSGKYSSRTQDLPKRSDDINDTLKYLKQDLFKSHEGDTPQEAALAEDIWRDRKKNIAKGKGFTPKGNLKRNFGVTADEKAQNEANRKSGRRGLGQLKNK